MRSPIFDIRKRQTVRTVSGGFDTGVPTRVEISRDRYCADPSCYKKLSKYNREEYCFVCLDARFGKEAEVFVAAVGRKKGGEGKKPPAPKAPTVEPVPERKGAEPEPLPPIRKYKAWVRMIDILGEDGPLTAGQMLKTLKISGSTAHNSVKLLKEEGLIRQTGIVLRGKRTARVYGLTTRGRAIYDLKEPPPGLVLTRAAKA